MDANGVLAAVFDNTTAAGQPFLRADEVANDPPPPAAPTRRDANGVLAAVFDPATNSLRVTSI